MLTAVYIPLPSRICAPPVTVSTCASREIQIADRPAKFLTNALPFVGPRSNKVVDNASDTVAVLETALTANTVFSGIPDSGLMIWPAESFPSKLGAVCYEGDTLP